MIILSSASFRFCLWAPRISVLSGDAVDAHCREQGIPYKYPSLCHHPALHARLVNVPLCPVSLCNCPLLIKCVKKYVAFVVSRELSWLWASGSVLQNRFPTNVIWCINVSLGLPLLIWGGLFVSYNWLVFVCWLWFLKSAEMGFPLPPVTYYFVCSLFLLRGRGQREGRRKMDLRSLWLADNWATLTGW